jgi:hypothetical protein
VQQAATAVTTTATAAASTALHAYLMSSRCRESLVLQEQVLRLNKRSQTWNGGIDGGRAGGTDRVVCRRVKRGGG